LLVGCTNYFAQGPEKAKDVPTFSGPWASKFEGHYRDATSDFVREVLRDGVITDQEHAEMTDRYRRCMDAAGVTFTDFNPDGSSEYTFDPSLGPDKAHAAEVRCSAESGGDLISSLYFWIKKNPDNLDDDTIMSECLIKSGEVPATYTPDEYRRDVDSGTFSILNDSSLVKAYDDCAADPLGLIHGK
jgi:hypothetical protein